VVQERCRHRAVAPVGRCANPNTTSYRERYDRNKARLGKQRGAKVAQVDIARKLAEAIWHMLTLNQPFAPQAPHAAWIEEKRRSPS